MVRVTACFVVTFLPLPSVVTIVSVVRSLCTPFACSFLTNAAGSLNDSLRVLPAATLMPLKRTSTVVWDAAVLACERDDRRGPLARHRHRHRHPPGAFASQVRPSRELQGE